MFEVRRAIERGSKVDRVGAKQAAWSRGEAESWRRESRPSSGSAAWGLKWNWAHGVCGISAPERRAAAPRGQPLPQDIFLPIRPVAARARAHTHTHTYTQFDAPYYPCIHISELKRPTNSPRLSFLLLSFLVVAHTHTHTHTYIYIVPLSRIVGISFFLFLSRCRLSLHEWIARYVSSEGVAADNSRYSNNRSGWVFFFGRVFRLAAEINAGTGRMLEKFIIFSRFVTNLENVVRFCYVLTFETLFLFLFRTFYHIFLSFFSFFIFILMLFYITYANARGWLLITIATRLTSAMFRSNL